MVNLSEFKKNKDFLICVDSDGCAMDTMDIKHFKCFGPETVKEWHLEKWEDEILKRWNEINLYSMTRGINRFAGLALALDEINKKYCEIDYIDDFLEWTKTAAELSTRAVEKRYKDSECPIFSKVLNWSNAVNAHINQLDDKDKKAFDNVYEALEYAHEFADIAVVSSANKEAVKKEWQRCKLLDFVDCLCCQDSGTKAICIDKLKKLDYGDKHILMMGDAAGDMAAAKENNVYFYPILVRKEEESWKEFKEEAVNSFVHLDYVDYGKKKEKEFLENLK